MAGVVVEEMEQENQRTQLTKIYPRRLGRYQGVCMLYYVLTTSVRTEY